MSETMQAFLIALLTQTPLALYTIWNGVRRNKPEIRKTEAEEEAILSGAMEGAGKTLENAWKRINELEKRDAERETELSILRRNFRRVERQLSDWRNYSAQLSKKLIEEAHLTPPPFVLSPDTEDAIQAITEQRRKFQESRKP